MEQVKFNGCKMALQVKLHIVSSHWFSSSLVAEWSSFINWGFNNSKEKQKLKYSVCDGGYVSHCLKESHFNVGVVIVVHLHCFLFLFKLSYFNGTNRPNMFTPRHLFSYPHQAASRANKIRCYLISQSDANACNLWIFPAHCIVLLKCLCAALPFFVSCHFSAALVV